MQTSAVWKFRAKLERNYRFQRAVRIEHLENIASCAIRPKEMFEDLLDNDDIKLVIECAGAKVVIGKTH